LRAWQFACQILCILLKAENNLSEDPIAIQFKSGQSKDLITIQSMWEWPEQGSDCNLLYVRMARARIWLWFNLFVAHHFGAVFENPNNKFCGWGV
jgi:hypothetical protein